MCQNVKLPKSGVLTVKNSDKQPAAGAKKMGVFMIVKGYTPPGVGGCLRNLRE